MNKKIIVALLVSLFAAPGVYAEAEQHKGAIDNCVKSALDGHPGDVITLRAETEGGKPQYELDIHGKDGKHWEVECDAVSGKIIETEREVAVDDPEFTSKAKVRLDAAMKTALDKYPGNIMKIEYEIEGEAGVAYEFDIKSADGKMLEVEVDAITGKLSDPEQVIYQIGLD
jgi:uncharacterized membrane protein YkoI